MVLKMPVVIVSKKRILNILVDSGAQVDLIRLGLFSEHLRNAQNPVRLRMANGMPMLGGMRSIILELAFERTLKDDNPAIWSAPVEFYEGEIGCDAYLSFPTLRRLQLLVVSDEGCLARKWKKNTIDRLTPVFPPQATSVRYLNSSKRTRGIMVFSACVVTSVKSEKNAEKNRTGQKMSNSQGYASRQSKRCIFSQDMVSKGDFRKKRRKI